MKNTKNLLTITCTRPTARLGGYPCETGNAVASACKGGHEQAGLWVR